MQLLSWLSAEQGLELRCCYHSSVLSSPPPDKTPPELILDSWVGLLEPITWLRPLSDLDTTSFLQRQADGPQLARLVQAIGEGLGLVVRLPDELMFGRNLSVNTTATLKSWDIPAGSRPLKLTMLARIQPS